MSKTAKGMLDWIKTWTPQQRQEFAELADRIEAENRGPSISTSKKTCPECCKTIERGQYICIIDNAFVDEWEVPKGELVYKIQQGDEYPIYYHEDCLGKKLM